MLVQNYINLNKEYLKYPVFHCLFNAEDLLVAFAGVQTHSFPKGICRFLTRFYISPLFRFKKQYVMTGGRPSFLTELILKTQIRWAKEQEIKTGFVSMQYLKRRSYLKRWTVMRNKYPGFGQWKMHEDMYLTCPNPSEKSCWQLISSTALKGEQSDTLGLPQMSIKDYNLRFNK